MTVFSCHDLRGKIQVQSLWVVNSITSDKNFPSDDMQIVDDHYEIITSVESFESVRKAVEDAGINTETAELTRIPQNTVNVDEKNCKSLLRLMGALEDHDDIQKVYSNFDITDELMATIEQNS